VAARFLSFSPRPRREWATWQLDRVALPHSTFTADALALIVRASEGILRRTRNLCLAALLEAVRERARSVDLKQVNRVLLQPHWREQQDPF
jgi:hypothetical protein